MLELRRLQRRRRRRRRCCRRRGSRSGGGIAPTALLTLASALDVACASLAFGACNVKKTSSDKSGWSFRKKSDRHHVLGNSGNLEPISVSYNNESPEAASNNFQSPKSLAVPEEIPIEEASLSSVIVNSEVHSSSVTGRKTIPTEHNVEDSIATVIQAGIRGYISRRELLKLKNVVILQAAVRGHLIRNQAIGTWRCVQAIIKMQILVRARYTCQHVHESAEKDNGKLQMGTGGSVFLENRGPCVEACTENSSTEKLLSNRFARQLLESTPKSKQIYIKCDPLGSDSAWKWLERWMAVASLDKGNHQVQNSNEGYENEESNKLAAYEATNKDPVAVVSIPDPELVPIEPALPSGGTGNFVTESSAECLSSLTKNDHDLCHLDNEDVHMALGNTANSETFDSKNLDSLSGQGTSLSNEVTESMLSSFSDKHEFDSSYPNSTNRASSELLDNESKKLASVSRKPSNPAFVAVQLKFEELSSIATIGRSANHVHHDVLSESKSNNKYSQVEHLSNTKGLTLKETSVVHAPRFKNATSESGTEISISSTLDSTDRSEVEGGEIVLEIGSLEKGNYDVNGDADDAASAVNKYNELKSSSLHQEALQPERQEKRNGNLANMTTEIDELQMEKQQVEITVSNLQSQIGNKMDPQVHRSSPEGTPRSRTAVPDSHGTPSSEVSVNTRKGKKNNIPTQTQKPLLSGKRSPSNPNHDSGGRSSTEHLPKAKSKNSPGMANPDHVDHDPRISNSRTSSSNSLPSYMQVTESARAKAHPSISPKSSPDVHDKDNYPKKRHSLPIGNSKQGASSSMQRSASQAQQNSRSNETLSPHNSAERRWQR